MFDEHLPLIGPVFCFQFCSWGAPRAGAAVPGAGLPGWSATAVFFPEVFRDWPLLQEAPC